MLLKINLSNIKEGHTELQRQVMPTDVGLGDQAEFQHPLDIQIRIDRVGTTLTLVARTTGRLTMVCDRCAEDYEHELDESLTLVFSSDSDLADQDEDWVFYLGEVDQDVDISDPIRQTLLLALPLKRLCSESCAGLCPVCGTNLNESTCSCKRDRIDPRWGKLRDLLGDS